MRNAPITAQSIDSLDDYSVTEAVVAAVADARDISPLEVTPPLAAVLDPDALELFVASLDEDGDDAFVTFTYAGFEVTVSPDAAVALDPVDA